MEQELYVWDTELTVPLKGRCHLHSKTKRPWRVSDGEKPEMRIIQPAKKVVKDG